MQSTDGGLEHRKPGFSGCVVRSSPKQRRQNLQSYKHFGTAHGCNKLRVLDSKLTASARVQLYGSRPRCGFFFTWQRKAISRRAAKPPGISDVSSNLNNNNNNRRQSRRQTVPTCHPRHAHIDDALLESKSRRQTTPRQNENLARAETG